MHIADLIALLPDSSTGFLFATVEEMHKRPEKPSLDELDSLATACSLVIVLRERGITNFHEFTPAELVEFVLGPVEADEPADA